MAKTKTEGQTPGPADTLTATFTYEKATKNKHRYQEDGDEPIVGALYVRKEALMEFGTLLEDPPKKVRVTVEVVE